MNNLSKHIRLALTTVGIAIVAATFFVGCNKQQTKENTPAKSSASEPTIKSAEKTSFKEVTSHLDSGGNMYGYLNTTEWFDNLSGHMEDWRDAALGLPNVQPEDALKINQGFNIVEHVVRDSGIEQVSGVGFSGIALEPGYYQTKFFVHHGEPSDGLIWSATGKAAHPLTQLDWLPSETAWAMFGDFDFGQVWNTVTSELTNSSLPEASEAVTKLEEQVKQSSGLELSQILNSLGGDYGIVLALNPQHRIPVPTMSTNQLEVNEPGLIIAIKVKDDTLFDLIDKNLKSQKNVLSVEKNGYRARVIPVPLPLPIALRPTIARFENYLLFASNDALLDNIAETKSGKRPGLKTTPEFQRLAKGMPTQGNQLVYVSQEMGKTFRDLQDAYLNSPLAAKGDSAAAASLVRKMFQNNPVSATYSVGAHLPDGWMNTTHGNKNPVTIIAGPLMVAPVAIGAGMVLPALAKARDRAVSVTCVSNLKQISIAIQMYANENNGKFPPSFASLKEYLGSPKVLICPSAKNHPDLNTLTWENLKPSQISYDLMTPQPGDSWMNAKTVIARCHVHGHTCTGDGAVHPVTKDKKSE